MRTRVVVVADVDPAFVRQVSSDEQFELETRICSSPAELMEAVSDAHVIVSRAYTPLSAEVIRSAGSLELIVQGTSGIDNIDLTEAAARDVRIISTPGRNARAVGEMVIGLMLSLTRTIPSYDRAMKEGDWRRSDCDERHELRHYDLGVIGIGRVGTQVTRLARLFGCTVRAYDPYLQASEIAERGATRVDSLQELLSLSRVITVHVPLTSETRGMIGSPQLAAIPPQSFLINTSRGEVVDAGAVLISLSSGHLAGAALDVFDPEPPSRTWPNDPRLILTPHVAGCTAEAKGDAGEQMYRELCAFYGIRR